MTGFFRACRVDEIRVPAGEFGTATGSAEGVDLERLTSLGYVGASGVARSDDRLFD